MKNLFNWLALCGFFLAYSVFAREPVDISLEINSSHMGGEAKQDAFDQATEQATRRIAEDLLGDDKTAQNWPQIKAKLLKNSTRYILFIKGSAPAETPGGGSRVTVQLRLAPDGLETILREMGLFAGGSIRLLPLIQVGDSQGARFTWWADPAEDRVSSPPAEYFKKIFHHLNAHFKAKSIYVLDPTVSSFRLGVPTTYRSENLRREDQAMLAQYLKADVVLSGRVDVQKLRSESPEQRVDFNLQLWQTKTGRVIGEMTRSETVVGDSAKAVYAVLDQADKKIFADLAGKLGEAAAGGSLNLNTLRIAVVGRLNYKQIASLKHQLEDLRDVRVLKERLFEPSKVTFEAETLSSAPELGKVLQKARFSGFTVDVEGAQDDGLILAVRATSAQ